LTDGDPLSKRQILAEKLRKRRERKERMKKFRAIKKARRAAREAAAKLAAQISAYCPLADACVNGQQVLGESSADLAGLRVAFDAYHLSLQGKPDKVIDGMTPPRAREVAQKENEAVWIVVHRP